jgi:glycosyltransferase involved in cell wall biosynthesis
LFVGLIRASKGILVLIDAMGILAKKGLPFRADIVGKFESQEFEHTVQTRIENLGLMSRIAFKGVLTGVEKHDTYLNADIFCFPSFFESFGLVAAEAMQFELPVVASRAQGLQSLVIDGVTGFLTEVDDSTATANKIEQLLLDPELRRKMGYAGRQRYLKEYSIEKFHANMDRCFSTITRESR